MRDFVYANELACGTCINSQLSYPFDKNLSVTKPLARFDDGVVGSC